MLAMQLQKPGVALQKVRLPDPEPGPNQVLVRVAACGVCRTDLHLVDAELACGKLPLIPGHEIVGRIEAVGAGVTTLGAGDRIGIAWLGHTCGQCAFCRSGHENLCDAAKFTGCDFDGGYADLAIADAAYCYRLPATYSDVAAAPLLCAGLIGYRSLRLAGDAQHLGLYGFGAAAHIIAQVAQFEGRSVYAFTRPGDAAAQTFARQLGCVWAGDSDVRPPAMLDAAILFAPVGSLVPAALASVRKGGTVVLGGIHMSDIPSMPYALLWGERIVRSVANLTRQDAIDFMQVAARMPINTHVEPYGLNDANLALDRLRAGELTGAAVLVTDTG